MEGIERVEQKDDTHLHWVADVGGEKREWNAEVTEQHPDERVAWRGVGQDGPNGVVTFHLTAPRLRRSRCMTRECSPCPSLP